VGVVRSLGREGIPLVAVDFVKKAPGLRSRYARPLLVPDPVKDPQGVLDILLRDGDSGSRSVLYPTSDAFVLFMSRYRDELSERFIFNIPSERVLEGMVNKRLQYEEANRVGTPIANTHYPTDMADIERIEHDLDYPVFIKPLYSHLWHERFGNKGFKVANPRELGARFEEIFAAGLEALVQSIILGPNTNHVKVCAYYGTDGGLGALFQTRKQRQYPTEFGVGTIMHSIHDPEVAKMGLRFFEGVGYRGVGSIEFKLDDRDGKYKMIELNPRLWAQNSQATYAGVNFSLIEYLDVTGQGMGPAPDWKDNVRWMDSFEDLQAFSWFKDYGMVKRRDLINSWMTIDCHAYFAWDDLGPVWAHTGGGVEAAKLLVALGKMGRADRVSESVRRGYAHLRPRRSMKEAVEVKRTG